MSSADGIEFKFNPWHDPETGRFTFVGAGQHYGQWGGGEFSGGGGGKGGGASGSEDWPVRSSRPKSQHVASRASTRNAPPAATPVKRTAPARPTARGAWGGGGFVGGGGGGFGGAGASGTWGLPDPKRRPDTAGASSDRSVAKTGSSTQLATTQTEQFQTVVRNGYTYQIDTRGRTRRVSGALAVARVPIRSRTSQAQAGGTERRATDDGGHYIAARFNGPTEAFNHFAQDANFNRGSYRVLEDEWAREKRAGRSVTVRIVPRFDGASVRPSMIDVWWTVDGNEKSLKFPNKRSETSRGKR